MTTPEKRVLFILSEDSSGGMAKYCKRLVSDMKSDNLDVQILFLREFIEMATKPSSGMHRVIRFVRNEIRIYKAIKRSRATSIVAFQNGVVRLTLLPSKLLRIRVVVSERSGPSVYQLTKSRKTRLLTWLLYSLADSIVVQFPRFKNGYPIYLGNKITVIPNSIEIDGCVPLRQPGKMRVITYLGRLSFEKNIDILVESFFAICTEAQDVELLIVGDGPEESKIRGLVENSSFKNRVKILPFTQNVCQVLAETTFLVQVSKWEGFPNAVAEALAHGIPVLGSEACDGVRDLVEEGKNGHKVLGRLDVASLTTGLEYMLNNHTFYRQHECREVILHFSPKVVVGKWKLLLGDLG